MKNPMFRAILFLFLCANFAMFSQKLNYVENQLIIGLHANPTQFNSNTNTFGIPAIDDLNQKYAVVDVEIIGNTKEATTYLITFSDTRDISAATKEYQTVKEIAFAEPNYLAEAGGVRGTNTFLFPNDLYFSRQWGLYNDGSFTVSGMPYSSVFDADVDMELAWNIETGDPNLIIAVSDSGLNMTHVDIASRVWNKASEPIDGIDNDGNGLIDDYRGWDWVNADNNPTDDHGHGSNCAGIIGTVSNNSIGYTGANWNSKIMPLKVLNNANSGTYANMANSIYYAVDNGAKIISMSIGGSGASTLVSNALDYANTNGVLFIACMMNFNNNTTYYPAGYATTKSNVMAVGSTNSNDQRTNPFFWSGTSGSNYGNHINVVAPGNYIWGLGIANNTDYNSYWGGTSQATPLVAGIASLLKSKNPALTPAQMRTIIMNTAQDQVGIASEDIPGWDTYMGSGRVNANSALTQVMLGVDSFNAFADRISIVNPVQNKELKIITSDHLSGMYSFSLINLQGQKIQEEKRILNSGSNTIPFPYAKGNYILTVKGEKYTKVFKIVNP
ncbi:T9SS type A sorting domain-containing protein [Flavobacterium amnicola]|uniref:T9SS type A sorting domain-containing protein n=2 Tax=Flavobacterium amnicola TaxID=2506422 RepID=A0A4Q1K2M0_9FLAO|nr:T9SS type A sorting domain-containing protein [Flavobacterium amnicola]